jgi:hypothetical protein
MTMAKLTKKQRATKAVMGFVPGTETQTIDDVIAVVDGSASCVADPAEWGMTVATDPVEVEDSGTAELVIEKEPAYAVEEVQAEEITIEAPVETAPAVQVVYIERPSAMALAREFYKNNPTMRRTDMVKYFHTNFGIAAATARTYYQKFYSGQ